MHLADVERVEGLDRGGFDFDFLLGLLTFVVDQIMFALFIKL